MKPDHCTDEGLCAPVTDHLERPDGTYAIRSWCLVCGHQEAPQEVRAPSREEREARRPPPPADLVLAPTDRAHEHDGRVVKAKAAHLKKKRPAAT